MKNRTVVGAISPLAIAASLLSAPPAYAQQAAPVGAPQLAPDTASTRPAPSNEDIIVTGTRLRSGFATPTPVTVMSMDQLQTRSSVSAGDALAQLPAFAGTRTTTNLGAVSSTLGAAQALLNLRNLGANRVLVLLDGERLPATNVNGSVDTNVIPQALLKRVEVVTGGASAGYGSDAVAGVVNFIIDNRFTGLKLDMSGGQTMRNDSANGHISLSAGKSLADDRLHVVASLDYFGENGIQLGPNGRSWFDNGGGFVTLPGGSATTFGLIPDARFSTMAYGGLVTSVRSNSGQAITVPGLSGMQFGPNGTLIPFDKGTNTGSLFQSGGSGPKAYNGLSPDQKRINIYAHAEYDLNDNLTLFAGATYSRSRTYAISADAFEQGSKGFTIYANNAYLPTAVAQAMATNNIASFVIGRYSADLPPVQNLNISTLQRYNLGLRGKLGTSWSFDTGFAYAVSRQDFEQYGTLNRNLYAAADAVVGPGGQIVCRSTLSGYDPGCVPMNVLGTNTVTTAAANYVSAWNVGITTDRQAAFNFNIRGDLGDNLTLGAGPITVASGFAWHQDRIRRVVDANSAIYNDCTGLRAGGCSAYNGVYGGYQSYNPGPLDGRVSASELYVEIGVPVIKDKPFFQALNLNAAGRATDYSTSGLTYTWKLGGTWDIDSQFRIRVSRSQDIRAPSANELFSTVSSSATNTSVLYPNSTAPGGLATTSTVLAVGNPNLRPEVAETWTAGAVYRPNWLRGFQISLDYYDINIGGAIGTLATQTIVDGCSAGQQAYCSLISVGGNPVTSTAALNGASGIAIRSVPLNIASIATSGFDIEAAYHTPLAGGRFDGRVIGNLVNTFTNSSATFPNGPILIGAYGLPNGAAGSTQPRWTLDVNANYEHPVGKDQSLTANVDVRFISSGQYNPNYTAAQFPVSQQAIPTISYTNLTLGYKFKTFGGEQQVSFQIANLFDQDPPNAPSSSTFQAPTNFGLYDVLGRRWTLSLKAKW